MSVFQFQEKRTLLWAIPLPLLALIFPVLLMPLERVFPYPYIVEEMAKAILVFVAIVQVPDKSFQRKMVFILGCMFALSESAFYLPSFESDSIIRLFSGRVLLTTTLHVFTMMILLFFIRRRRWCVLIGFVFAVAVHFLYNEFALHFL